MAPAAGGSQTLERRIRFVVESDGAVRDAKRLQDQVKQTSQAAAAAEKDLARMGRGVGGPVGRGGSMATAHAESMAAGQPSPGFKAPPGMPPLPAPKKAAADKPAGEAAMAALSKAMAVAAALDLGAKAVLGFVHAMNQASAAVDMTGQRAPGGAAGARSAVRGLADMPLAGDFARVGWQGAEWAHRQMSPSFRKEMDDNVESARQSDLALAAAGPRDEAARSSADLHRRRRGLADDADSATAFAAGERERTGVDKSGRAGALARAIERAKDPAQAEAERNVERAKFNLKGADESAAAAATKARTAHFGAIDALSAAEAEREKNRGITAEQVVAPLGGEAAARVQGAEADLKRKELEAVQAIQKAREATELKEQSLVAKAQKQLELRRAEVDLGKVRLSQVDQELAKRDSANTEFGMQGPAERQAVYEALKRSKSLGFDGVSAEDRSLLAGSSATADYAREQAKKAGERDAVGQAIIAELGGRPREALEAERRTLETTVKFQPDVNEAEFKKGMKEAVDSVFGDYERWTKELLESRVRGLEIQMAAAKAAGG